MKFKDKVAIVTGAGSGIGKATALLFGREGAKVVVATRTAANGEATTRAIRAAGGSAENVPTDVSETTEARRAIETTIERYGRLDILFNNAGFEGRIAEIADLGEDDWDLVLGINLKGTFLMTKFAIPHMARGGGGAIVNCSSTFGYVGAAGWGPYCASKAGILGLTRVLALECARQNIRVNAVCPGGTVTGMHPRYLTTPELEEAHRRRHPLGRFGSADEVAKAVLFLASDEASFVTGTSLIVDGGYTSV
jgi:NAD(P)-dependent dehydrogenase (short-subunit alcohol dehydrogenase family)